MPGTEWPGTEEATGRTLELLRFYSREHEDLHTAMLAVIVEGKKVRNVAREKGIDRAALGGHVGRFMRMMGRGQIANSKGQMANEDRQKARGTKARA